jgi:FixJ family two-component response regulator
MDVKIDPQRPGCVLLRPMADQLCLLQDTIRRLSREDCAPPIIVLLPPGEIAAAVLAIKCGAEDVLVEPFDPNVFVSMLPGLFAAHRFRISVAAHAETARKRFQSLTPRERQVASCVAMGLPNKETAFRLGITVGTVKIHRGRVMQKLALDSVVELVRLAMDLQHGLESSTPSDQNPPWRLAGEELARKQQCDGRYTCDFCQ